MKLIIPFLAVLFFSCTVEPQPIVYGKDVCHTCKMTLMDNKFGAEVVTAKGKVFKFDDSNCMINFMNSGYLENEKMAFKLIVDYSQPGKLIPVEQGYFLKSDEIRSPMNGGIAAFATERSMKEYQEQWKAIYLGWGEVQTAFK